VGCNLEDTDHHGDGDLVPADEQAARIGAVRDAARRAGVEVVLNARVDVFRGRDASEDAMEEGLRRARLYHEAGADCVYPITLADDAAIGAFVAGSSGPVNILRRAPAPSIARLAALGVARVSFGGELYRLAHRALTDALAEIRADTPAG
jgi:2-methylisocitrate lyase-like PEP mutase family enzyme